MKSFSNFSIKNKLIAIILGVTLLTLGLGFVIIILININTFKKDMVNNSIMNAKVIGEYCVTPLIFDDNSGAEEVLLKLKNIPSIVEGCVYDNEGNLFASFGNVEKDYEFVTPEDWTLNEFKGKYLHVIEPIIYHGEKYGVISIYVKTNLLNKKITNYLVTTLIILLILIVVSYFLALKFQTIISKPILNLANISGEITKKADYSIRAQKKGNDEIGILYDRFNEMIEQIELRTLEKDKAEEELEKHREHLEELVKGRTKELKETNKELERFNKLFIGREFRIKELKDKVKELEGRLG
jgi:methyl-accepting chemotaxis protein